MTTNRTFLKSDKNSTGKVFSKIISSYDLLDSEEISDPQQKKPIENQNSQENSPRSEALKSMLRSNGAKEPSPRSEKSVTINPIPKIHTFEKENQHLKFFERKNTFTHQIKHADIPLLNINNKSNANLDTQQESPTRTTTSGSNSPTKTSPKNHHLREIQIQNKILNYFANPDQMDEIIQHPTREQLTRTLMEALESLNEKKQSAKDFITQDIIYKIKNSLILLEQPESRFENHIEIQTIIESLISQNSIFTIKEKERINAANHAYLSEVLEGALQFVNDISPDQDSQTLQQITKNYEYLRNIHLQNESTDLPEEVQATLFLRKNNFF